MIPTSDAIVEALTRTDIRTLDDTLWRDWSGRLLSPLDRYLVTSAGPEHFAAARTQILGEHQRLREEVFRGRAEASLWQELIDIVDDVDPDHDDPTLAVTIDRMPPSTKARANEAMLLIEAMRQ